MVGVCVDFYLVQVYVILWVGSVGILQNVSHIEPSKKDRLNENLDDKWIRFFVNQVNPITAVAGKLAINMTAILACCSA